MRLARRSDPVRGSFELWLDEHPPVQATIIFLILAVPAVMCVTQLEAHQELLRDSFPARVMVGVWWVLAWGALGMVAHALLKRSPKRHDQRPTFGRIIGLVLATAVLLAPLVVFFSTFERDGEPYPVDVVSPEDAVPRLAFVLGSIVVGGPVGTVLILRYRRSLQAPAPGEPVTHEPLVLDVRPSPGDDFEPYFVGTCSCGWVGPVREDVKSATADTLDHCPTWQPKVFRPLA